MLRFRGLVVLAMLALVGQSVADSTPTEAQLRRLEDDLTKHCETCEAACMSLTDVASSPAWTLRSKHFVFGMPVLKDRRHDFKPDGDTAVRPGVTVLVREGFVVAHFDRMRTPLFVCQRWTRADRQRIDQVPDQPRNWREDLELPTYARKGTSYSGNQTKMDRGHMARHADNRAWGVDNSDLGCQMSNSAPQHKEVNRGAAWRTLEDAVQAVVENGSDIPAIWTITGTLYRDPTNPGNETSEDDFDDTDFIGGGFGKPKAVFKVVGWFDDAGEFQARGYVFEQTDRAAALDGYRKKIRDIEERAGVNFFPLLKNEIANTIETTAYDDMWGAQ